jgi:hypothetical protein
MLYSISTCLFLLLNLPYTSSTTTTTPALSPLISSNYSPFITHFLVYASNMETVITFEPKHGWLIKEERDFRLYLSGYNLQNSSIVFSASIDECTSSDYISPIYTLSSALIHEINVVLKGAPKGHSSVYICLLTSSNVSLSLSNNTEIYNATQLEGSFFTFLREKGPLPFAAKICLILMLFIVSGFFR